MNAVQRRAQEAKAAGALYVAVMRAKADAVPWVSEMGPLNTAERARVRRFVAAIITWECSGPRR